MPVCPASLIIFRTFYLSVVQIFCFICRGGRKPKVNGGYLPGKYLQFLLNTAFGWTEEYEHSITVVVGVLGVPVWQYGSPTIPTEHTRLAPYWGALYLYKYGSMRGWSLSPMSQSTRVSFTPPTVLCPGEIALSHAPGTVPGTMVRVKANLQISSDC